MSENKMSGFRHFKFQTSHAFIVLLQVSLRLGKPLEWSLIERLHDPVEENRPCVLLSCDLCVCFFCFATVVGFWKVVLVQPQQRSTGWWATQCRSRPYSSKRNIQGPRESRRSAWTGKQSCHRFRQLSSLLVAQLLLVLLLLLLIFFFLKVSNRLKLSVHQNFRSIVQPRWLIKSYITAGWRKKHAKDILLVLRLIHPIQASVVDTVCFPCLNTAFVRLTCATCYMLTRSKFQTLFSTISVIVLLFVLTKSIRYSF